MTDTTFYDDMAALAAELLTDFGTPATYRVVSMGKPNAQGISTRTTTDSPGLAVQTLDQTVLQALDVSTETALVARFPAEPAPLGLVVFAGTTFKVLRAKLVKPLGTSMLVAFLACVPA